MRYASPLVEGVLVARRQRFLADVVLPEGQVLAHVPNTGSLLGCLVSGQAARLSRAADSARRCPFTLEQIKVNDQWVGVHTQRANGLLGELLQAQALPSLASYTLRRSEVPYGTQRSRIDWLLSEPGLPDVYVEIKSVTASLVRGEALFPDAPSARALKHVEELEAQVLHGQRAMLVFCVQRDDVGWVSPADQIDPAYGRALRRSVHHGVEVMALAFHPDHTGLHFTQTLPVRL